MTERKAPVWDVVSLGETMLRLTPPHQGRIENAAVFESHVAGSESNTLCLMARLGLRAAWISALPNNPNGRRVARTLHTHGTDTSGVVWDDDARLGTYYAEESPAPLGPVVVYDRTDSAFARLDPDCMDLSRISQTRLLHMTGISPALGPGPRELFDRALNTAHEAGVAVSLDVNYRARLWNPAEAASAIDAACRQARVLICAQGDAAVLWGLEGEPEAVLAGLRGRFARPGEKKTIVLTCGADGSASWDENGFDTAPIFACGGRFRFGSGDAFGGGYLTAWLRCETGQAPANAASPLRYGNAAAALKRCIQGDIAVIGQEDLDRLIHTPRGYFR